MKTLFSFLAYCLGLVVFTLLSAADTVFDWIASKDWSVFFIVLAIVAVCVSRLQKTQQIQNLVNDDKP